MINAHLVILRKVDFVKISGDSYIITAKGKEVISFPAIKPEDAKKIIRKVSPENAFKFYIAINHSLSVASQSNRFIREN